MLNPYAFLAIAILSEVFGSSMLKVSNGFKRLFPSIGVVIGMGLAFYCLSLSLITIPLGTAYAIWSGIGTALTALVGVIVYKEGFNLKKLLGLVLIIGGVVVLKLSSEGTS
ncbi:multidrug efflux SMR transporter [Peribacillus frigoritolerans]|nr:multidrug efflux SMR transporter [Peribacillus frigoritolerans]